MLGKIKKVLGIEGVKVECKVFSVDTNIKKIEGELKFTTKTTGKIKMVNIKLIERYSRGRGKNKLIDEYTIANLDMYDSFEITPEEIVEIPFAMNYELAMSPMDKMQKDNFISRPFIGLLKFAKKVKSEFSLLVEADVEGTTLNPYDKVPINLK